MRADDVRTQPDDGAEFHGDVAEGSFEGFVLLVGRFGHVGAAVLQPDQRGGTEAWGEEGCHG